MNISTFPASYLLHLCGTSCHSEPPRAAHRVGNSISTGKSVTCSLTHTIANHQMGDPSHRAEKTGLGNGVLPTTPKHRNRRNK